MNLDTLILFYKIHQGDVEAIDYSEWAVTMLKEEQTSLSLYSLSSLRKPLNLFETEDYFNRTLRELDIRKPSFEECADYYIQHLSKTILEDEDYAIDLAYRIYEVSRDLDEPDYLYGWYLISEMIDEFRYGSNQSHLSKAALMVTIEQEAKKQLKRRRINP
jgi:hypothetical protein